MRLRPSPPLRRLLRNALCALLFGLGVLPVLAVELVDDFSAASLNAALWTSGARNADSSVTVDSGEVVLQNLGYILTQQEFSTNLTITGRMRMTGNDHDVFNLRLRINEVFPVSASTLFVQFAVRDNDYGPLGVDNIAIYNSGGVRMVKASYPFVIGQYHTFKVVDDGKTVTVSLNDSATPVATLDVEGRAGNRVAVSNRERQLERSYSVSPQLVTMNGQRLG